MQANKYSGLKAKRNGSNFERLIEMSCAYYQQMGVAHIQKTPEPFRLLRKQGSQAIGIYEKKAQPDFTGTLKGGKSIVFEAKHTNGTNMPFDRINDTQERDLAYHSHLGARASIIVSFSMKHFYMVPYADWKELKETIGKKSVNQSDLVDYQLSTEKGILNFLEGVK